MKTKASLLLLNLFMAVTALHAQQRVTVKATSYDISDNLDLEAVASMFGDSRNLEEFERSLNDPEYQISNLDLNEDGYVDYLRVVESSEDGLHLILIQAVLARDVYQDVASIDVEKRGSNVVVQVVGNRYIYGPNYIIEPFYVQRPVIFNFFWGPSYVRWVSPYYYGYYPVYYRQCRPRPVFAYHRHVHHHIHTYHTYHHVTVRRSNRAYNMYQRQGRNDYAQRNPQRSFQNRNSGVSNRRDLIASRESVTPARSYNRSQPARQQNSRSVSPSPKRANVTPQRNTSTPTRSTPAYSNASTPARSLSEQNTKRNVKPARNNVRYVQKDRATKPAGVRSSASRNATKNSTLRNSNSKSVNSRSNTSRSTNVRNNVQRSSRSSKTKVSKTRSSSNEVRKSSTSARRSVELQRSSTKSRASVSR